MSDVIRAGIIGLGGISGAHISNYKAIDGVELVAAAEVNEAALKEGAAKHGLQPFSDWKKMLDEAELNVVSVCTPPFLHREMVCEALSRGIHVMCEKPLAASSEDADAIAEAARNSGARLMIAYCHRWHPTIVKTRQLIDAGILGKPLFFRCAFAGWIEFADNHRASKKQAGGGALMDNGSHATDIYQFLFGKIANVSCRAGTLLQDMETDDVAIMIFEGDNGCFGEILVGYSLPGDHTEFKIVGEKGVLKIEDYFGGPVKFQPKGSGEWLDHEVVPGDRFRGEFEHFIDCVRKGTEPISNAQTALHVHRVITSAYADSQAKGVSVPK